VTENMITSTDDKLSVVKQCELLSVTRSKFYYVLVGFSNQYLDILGKLEKFYTENPTYGTRIMKSAINKIYGIMDGRRKMKEYIDTLNIAAIYPENECHFLICIPKPINLCLEE
jgi:putative transposase